MKRITTGIIFCLLVLSASSSSAITKGWKNPQEGLPSSGTIVCTETINVNEATAQQLQLLYRIGEVMSQRIVEEREKAPFESPNDLTRVKGIGEKTLQYNWLWISTDGETTLSVKVPSPEVEVNGNYQLWEELPGCPNQNQ